MDTDERGWLFPFADGGIVLSAPVRVYLWFQQMKSQKKKVAFSRRTWQINPVTRMKGSAMKHSHLGAKDDLQKQDE
jgi:hypothetical protein